MKCSIIDAVPKSAPTAPAPRAELPPCGPEDTFVRGGDGPRPQAPVRKDPPGPLEEKALQEEREQQDCLRAQEIYARMRADRELWQAKLQALMADLQTEIFRILQEVMLRRRKVHDEVLKAWHKVLVDD